MSGLIKRHPKYSVLAPVGKTVRIQSSTAEKQASAKTSSKDTCSADKMCSSKYKKKGCNVSKKVQESKKRSCKMPDLQMTRKHKKFNFASIETEFECPTPKKTNWVFKETDSDAMKEMEETNPFPEEFNCSDIDFTGCQFPEFPSMSKSC